MNKKWRIIIGVSVILLFGFRIYMAFLEREEQKQQQEFIRELSRQQAKERMTHYDDEVQALSDSMMKTLEESRKSLDSIADELEKSNLNKLGYKE